MASFTTPMPYYKTDFVFGETPTLSKLTKKLKMLLIPPTSYRDIALKATILSYLINEIDDYKLDTSLLIRACLSYEEDCVLLAQAYIYRFLEKNQLN